MNIKDKMLTVASAALMLGFTEEAIKARVKYGDFELYEMEGVHYIPVEQVKAVANDRNINISISLIDSEAKNNSHVIRNRDGKFNRVCGTLHNRYKGLRKNV